MIPVKLTIEGLYSYQERQTIDFSDLTDAGLFGIFGAVGSGKSSILEAISYALYGETERLNARDKRTYNMMNLKSKRAYIAFDFLNYENKLFRATREFKRNSKNFEDVRPPVVTFYQWKDSEWIPLENANAENIVGLSYTNFKRTIIIPQGQFKEFLELGEADRTKMMKEIFGLERFDLHENTSLLNKKNQTELDQLQGKLSGYDEVSEEHIQLLQKQLTEENNIVVEKKQLFETADKKLKILEALKTDAELLQEKKTAFSQLNKQKETFDVQKVQLELYERVFKVFHPLFTEFNKTEEDIRNKSVITENQRQNLKNSEGKLLQTEGKIDELKPYFENLSNKNMEVSDLELIREISQFQAETEELKNRTKNGLIKVNEVENQIKERTANITKTEQEISLLKEKSIDTTVFMDAGNWFSQQQNLQKNHKIQKDKIQRLNNDIQLTNKVFKEHKIEISTFEDEIKNKQLAFVSQKKQLEEKRRDFAVRQELSHFSHNLQHGEACPLCGSKEHPSVVVLEDVTTQLQEIAREEEQLENTHYQWTIFAEKIKQQIQELSFLQKTYSEETTNLEHIAQQISQHKTQFIWEDFRADDFEDFDRKRLKTLALNKEIEAKSEQITEHRKALDILLENEKKFKNALEQFRLEEAQKTTQIQQNQKNLKVLDFADFSHYSADEIHKKAVDLKLRNEKTVNDYNALNQQFNQLNNQLASEKASFSATQNLLTELHQNKEKLELTFRINLQEQQIESKEKAKQIMDLQLDTVSIRNKMDAFWVAYQTLHQQIQELENKLKDFSFDENEYHQQKQQFSEIKTTLDQATENAVKTKTETDRLTKAFEEKKELLKQFETLKTRGENLKTMLNLFKGAGFVQYVSSIYLRQLCDHANERFHRMTRNQLSLQINDKGDFEIIDYLNEGKNRSVKTLSGGQGFQASLSLALALTESVQSNAKADKNFFFIDEGFGTQDADSVNIVFETLSNLQKENRIVGIISHVEELKERMPKSLSIVKDSEKGSLISMGN